MCNESHHVPPVQLVGSWTIDRHCPGSPDPEVVDSPARTPRQDGPGNVALSFGTATKGAFRAEDQHWPFRRLALTPVFTPVCQLGT